MTKRGIGCGLLLTMVGLGLSCTSPPRAPLMTPDGQVQSQFEVALEGFRFSKGLPNRKSNFRFIVGLRFFDKDSNFNTAHAILPGLDTYWECAKGEGGHPIYVRGPVEDGYVNFDMEAVGKWDSLIFVVKGIGLHSIQFKVFDVNRPDILEELKGFMRGLFAMGAKAATEVTPPTLAFPMQGLSEDLRLAVMNKITSKDDLLFRKYRLFDDNNFMVGKPEEYVLFSNGGKHNYEVTFTVTRKEVFN